MVRRERKSANLSLLMSWPSMTMRPDDGSMKRKKDRPRVDLPEPATDVNVSSVMEREGPPSTHQFDRRCRSSPSALP